MPAESSLRSFAHSENVTFKPEKNAYPAELSGGQRLPTSSKRRWIAVLLVCPLLAGVIGLGSVRRPYGVVESRAPVLPPSSATLPVTQFKVATFNIYSGRGLDRVRNLARTADVLRGMDVAGLNEVRGPSILGSVDQAADLGARLDAAAVFGPAERRWYVTSFGNGLLSRFPILTWRSQPLGAGGRGSYRAVILAEILVGASALRVLIAHAERGELRDAQLREVKAIFAQFVAPAVLLGDLNARADHPTLQEIQMLPGVAHALSGRRDLLNVIDHIYAKGLLIQSAGVTPTSASDHPLVWAELEYPGSHWRKDAPVLGKRKGLIIPHLRRVGLRPACLGATQCVDAHMQ